MKCTTSPSRVSVLAGLALAVAVPVVLSSCAIPDPPSGNEETGAYPEPDGSSSTDKSATSSYSATADITDFEPDGGTRSKRPPREVDAAELIADAAAFTRSASSVHLNIISLGDSTFTKTQKTFANSPDLYASQTNAEIGSHEIIRTGSTTYIKGTEKFWVSTGEVTAKQVQQRGIDEKWVQGENMSLSDLIVDVYAIFDKDGLSPAKLAAELTEVSEDTCSGEPGYLLETSNSFDFLSMCVAQDDHRLLSMTGDTYGIASGGEAGSMYMLSFYDWNEVAPIAPPPASEILNR